MIVLTPPKVTNRAVGVALARLASIAAVRRIRSIREFAEQELILPSGPHEGEKFKADRQPWVRLWLDALDSGLWRRSMLTGPGQAGKTLNGSAIPVMYHLFECSETVVYGAPTIDMANDKWRQDILPLIQASRYRDLLPERGAGSQGGSVTAIQFKNGRTLKFLTGGGGDKVRAGFTSRVAVVTEIDGLDDAGGTSRETDKLSQIEARTSVYNDRARIYFECTTSTEDGRTWRELKEGTDSRIAIPCPHCAAWVTPEREHLVGWQEASTVVEASQRASLACPACGAAWSEADRATANVSGRLVHKGQSIDASGTIVGMAPAAITLGFRFTASNNLFTTMARVAQEEWTAPRYSEAGLAEKKLRQFWWTLPSESESLTLTELDAAAITARVVPVPRGRVPAGAVKITVGVDLGKWLNHWVALAWLPDGTPHVVEYGRLEVPSNLMAVEVALLASLRGFRDQVCLPGWASVVAGSPNVSPSLTFVDARDWTSTAKAFCVESGAGFIPTQGHAATRVTGKWAADPGYDTKGYHSEGALPINADLWKSFLHDRLQTPAGQPGGLTLFHATPTEHLSFSKHLTAEKRVEEFMPGRGLVTRWEAISRNNHYLDASSLACAAGHAAGIRIVMAEMPQAPDGPPKGDATTNPLTSYRNRW